MALSKEISGLDEDISTWEMEHKEQAFLREKAHADFVKTHEEYSESIDSVERAVETIKAGPGSFFQREALQTSLLQLSSNTRVSEEKRRLIASFLQMPNPEAALMQDMAEVTGTAPEP